DDFLLITNVPSGSSTLSASGSPLLVPGGTYFLGVQNTNNTSVSYGVQVTFHLAAPPSTNAIPISSIVHTNSGFLLKWLAPSNDLFQVQWTPTLRPTNWTTFTNPPVITYDPTAFTFPTNTLFDFFDDGSQTGGFGPTRFYRLILLSSGAATPSVIALTNGVPFS